MDCCGRKESFFFFFFEKMKQIWLQLLQGGGQMSSLSVGGKPV